MGPVHLFSFLLPWLPKKKTRKSINKSSEEKPIVSESALYIRKDMGDALQFQICRVVKLPLLSVSVCNAKKNK